MSISQDTTSSSQYLERQTPEPRTHDNRPEEEEDQIDTWEKKIEPAEPKTVPTTATVPGLAIDATVGGTVTGANRGEIEGVAEFEAARAYEGEGIVVEAGTWQGGAGGRIEAVAVFEYELSMNGRIDGSIKSSTMTIPEITIKDPERNGTAKWKMIDRETEDTGMWNREDMVLEWKEAPEPKEPGLGGEPTCFRRQHTGQRAWADLIKCPRAVYRNRQIDDELDNWTWGDPRNMPRQKWGRWIRDPKIVTTGKSVLVTRQKFGLRRNEIPFVMLTMRRWRFIPLTENAIYIRKRMWFGQLRTETFINWY
jgi:hypothetical protein